MNSSFIFCNRSELVVRYEGMPMAHRPG
jgi:hypothetical protein